MEQVKAPQQIIDEFKEKAKREDQAAEDDPINEGAKEVLEGFTDTIKWAVNMMDEEVKNAGLPGISKMPPEKYAELLQLVAERNLPTKALEKTPEVALGTVTAGMLFQNYLAYQAQNKPQEKQKQDNE